MCTVPPRQKGRRQGNEVVLLWRAGKLTLTLTCCASNASDRWLELSGDEEDVAERGWNEVLFDGSSRVDPSMVVCFLEATPAGEGAAGDPKVSIMASVVKAGSSPRTPSARHASATASAKRY